MKNTMLIIIAACVVCAGAVVFFIGQNNNVSTNDAVNNTEVNGDEVGDGVYYEEEDDGAELNLSESTADKFFGTWVAKSELAKQTYGNVEITIEKGGTWTGVITDEPLEGKWTAADGGLTLTSTLFNCKLAFNENGTLLMIEDTGEEYADDLVTVLVKK